MNKNGVTDIWLIDEDKNGKIDTAIIDQNEDGIIEAIAFDDNENKNFEIFLFDDDLDGNADRAEIDNDDNGTSDNGDYDQDGKWDKYDEISKLFLISIFSLILNILFSNSVIAWSISFFSSAEISTPLSLSGSLASLTSSVSLP